MPGIGVLTNPRSRRNKRNPRLARRLAYIVGDSGQLEAPEGLGELTHAVQKFRERDVDIVAINGGDGTAHVALGALYKAYGDQLPRIALLRGGTMNTIAHGLGIRGDPESLLGRLVAQVHSGAPLKTASRHLMVVNDTQVGFLFGNGLISNFLEAYYEAADPSPSSAVWLLTRAIGSVLVGGELAKRITRPIRCRVTVDGDAWPERSWLTVAAGTVDDIGVGFRPFFKSLEYPGYFHAIGLGSTAAQFLPQLPRVYRGQTMTHPDNTEQVGRELILEAQEPIAYMLDGDFHRGGQRLVVRVGPRVEMVL
jgi:diacylglycerol kinase (ATP)